MNIMKMMKQAQKAQAEMQRLQAELAAKKFTATAGGGAVKVEATGAGDLTAVILSPDLIKEGDAEMIQDLILTAANDAIKQGREAMQQEISRLTSGIGLPGF